MISSILWGAWPILTFFSGLREMPKGEALKVVGGLEMREGVFIIGVCVIGLAGIGYGMVKESNPVFLLGLACVIAGYLMIRRRLKQHIAAKHSKE